MRCSLEIGGWDLMFDPLLNRRIDVYVGFPLAKRDSRIREERESLPALVGLCRPGHPFLQRRAVEVRDLPEFPIVAPRAPHWILEVIQQRAGIERNELQRPPNVLIASDFGVIRQIVKSTDATSSVFPDMVRDEVARGELATFRVQGVLPKTPVSIGYLAERSLPPLAQAFVSEIQAEIRHIASPRRTRAAAKGTISSRQSKRDVVTQRPFLISAKRARFEPSRLVGAEGHLGALPNMSIGKLDVHRLDEAVGRQVGAGLVAGAGRRQSTIR